MSSTSKASRRWGAAVVVPAVALVTAGVATAGVSGTATAAPARSSHAASGDGYINYVAPRAEKAHGQDVKLSKDAKKNKAVLDALSAGDRRRRQARRGQPGHGKQLAKLEAKAIKTGTSPKPIKSQYKNAKATQTAKLLTILVEFNEEANDDFTGVQVPEASGARRPASRARSRTARCTTTSRTRPTARTRTTTRFWVPDFSSEHFNKMLYTNEGITERVRTDLTGPDGKPGIDISGYTMKNMYEEMSKGAYTVTGAATPWVKVPHSEAYYGATTCHQNGDGVWVAGAVQDMQGHPDNPLGPGQLADRRGGRARRGPAELPVGRLRHRGPGRRRRRRQLQRARRRHRPRRAGARR